MNNPITTNFSNTNAPTTTASDDQPEAVKARTFRRNGAWFFQLAGDTIFGPFDKVFDTVMGDREFCEREMEPREVIQFMLQFA